jgi:hypothetical protein
MTSNFPTGLNNLRGTEKMGKFPYLTQIPIVRRIHDYLSYGSGDWVTTLGSTGTIGVVQVGNSPCLAMTTAATNNDTVYSQWAGGTGAVITPYVPRANNFAVYRTRFKFSANSPAIINGLQVVDTTPLAVTDGIYFNKDAGSLALSLIVKSAASGSQDVIALGNMAADTFIDVGWIIDPKEAKIFVVSYDWSTASFTDLGNASLANVPFDIPLTLSKGIKANTAAAVVLYSSFDEPQFERVV